MSQSDKSRYFQELKAAGVKFDKHYREYTTDELQAAWSKLPQNQQPMEQHEPPQVEANVAGLADAYANLAASHAVADLPVNAAPQPVTTKPIPRRAADPNEMAGQRLNTQTEDEPIRIDDQGRAWYQEEVRKPAFAKPRGRRVLQYMDRGTETRTVQDGQYVETFEAEGRGVGRPAEVKITLPSYQVGIYKDPRFPFKVHVYNGMQGFDLFEVENFYGGRERVPGSVKRIYVENVLCYDIRSVVRAIEDEYRQLQLMGKVK
jgi:hypothetical protein